MNGHRHTILIPPPASRARGRGERASIRPQWMLAELGQAAIGVPRLQFLAACFAWAGDRACFWELHRALHARAHRLAQEHRWPLEVEDLHGLAVPYLAHLAKLVLDEDHAPHVFLLPEVFALYLRITPNAWERKVEERYRTLKDVWLAWLHTAAGQIQVRLREDGEAQDDYG